MQTSSRVGRSHVVARPGRCPSTLCASTSAWPSKGASGRRSRCCAETPSPGAQGQATLAGRALSFVDAQFLPIGLLVAIVSGYFLPGVATAAANADAATAATTTIFLLSGALLQLAVRILRQQTGGTSTRTSTKQLCAPLMPCSTFSVLRTEAPSERAGLQMRRGLAAEALQYKGMYALGLACILAMTPLIAQVVLAAPIAPTEFAIGLAVFFCMPTSLSANIALAGVRLQCVHFCCACLLTCLLAGSGQCCVFQGRQLRAWCVVWRNNVRIRAAVGCRRWAPTQQCPCC